MGDGYRALLARVRKLTEASSDVTDEQLREALMAALVDAALSDELMDSFGRVVIADAARRLTR